MDFHALRLAPSEVHTLVGQSIWDNCWEGRKDNIHGPNIVPKLLLHILRLVLEKAAIPVIRDARFLEAGKLLYKAAATMDAERTTRLQAQEGL